MFQRFSIFQFTVFFFLQISDVRNNMHYFTDPLGCVKKQGSKNIVDGFSIVEALSFERFNNDPIVDILATYYGSFTSPPCYETVKWFILVEPLRIRQEQVLFLLQIV